MNDFKTCKQAAKILGVDQSRVRRLCLDGKLEGAFIVGEIPHQLWLIPASSVQAHVTAVRKGHKKPGRKPQN